MSPHEHFRSPVLDGACVIGIFLVRGSELFGEPKISQFDVPLSTDENVVRFEILSSLSVTRWK
jgi:hypothetical protein